MLKTYAASIAFVVVAAGALSATACTAQASDPASEETDSAGAALDNNENLGQGYSCTEAGYCQCSGIVDCDNMFHVCKADTYCNFDEHGYRCCCLNFVPRTHLTSPVPTVPMGASL